MAANTTPDQTESDVNTKRAKSGERQRVMPRLVPQWWCCNAEFGDHEPTCKNYIRKEQEHMKG